MKKYEGLFIFPPDEGPDASKAEEARLEETITRFGGKVLERHDWGKRLLGYSIRKHREGKILLWNFEMAGDQIVELRRQLELNEKILKSTIVKAVIPKPPKESAKKKKSFKEGTQHARQS